MSLEQRGTVDLVMFQPVCLNDAPLYMFPCKIPSMPMTQIDV